MAELNWDDGKSWLLRWSRTASALALMAVPIVAFVAGWLAHRLPWSLITSPHCEPSTWAVVASLAIAPVAYLGYWLAARTCNDRLDTELMFGAATVALTLLAASAAASSLFAWLPLTDSLGDNSGPIRFFWVAVFLGAALVLIAHDWTRRYLTVAATVAVLALGALVVRAGYEDPRIPDKVARTAVVTKANAERIMLAADDGQAVAKVKAQAKAARQTLTTELAARPPLAVTPALRAAAEAIATSDDTQVVRAGLVQPFENERLHEPDSDEPAATRLDADVHTFLDAQRAAVQAAPTSMSDLTAAYGKADAAAKSGVGWQQAADDLALQLAAYRAAVTGSPDDAKAYQELLAAGPKTTRVSLLDALTDGPQALWTAATDAHARPLVPGPLGWALLGAFLLWFWTLLLKVNAAQLAGPVKVSPDSSDDKDLAGVFRIAVLSNVEEPGTAPGAGVASPVTDLLDIAGGTGTPIGTIAKLVGLATKIAGRQYGYDLAMEVVTPKGTADGAKNSSAAPTSDQQTSVLVRVRTISNSQTIATQVQTEDNPEKAVRAAGLWAAGFVLNRSSRIPTWAEWEPDTAAAIASTQDEDAPLSSYVAAVRQAPRSGVLLVMTGHQYELADKPAKAIALYARAVAAHPTYRVARYRLGAALTTLGDADNPTWAAMKVAERDDLLRGVRLAAETLHLHIDDYEPSVENEPPSLPPGTPTARQKLNAIGRCVLEHLRVENRPHHRLVMSLRRSERDTWLPSPRTGVMTPAGRLRRIAYSAFLASAMPPDSEKLRRYASKPRQWWQASYNAACGMALTSGGKADALSMLEQSLLQRGIQQLKAEWVRSDADLSSLVDEPRFQAFLTQLPDGD